MKKSIFLWSRMVATLTDISFVYCIAILVHRIAWMHVPLKPGIIFIGVFSVYYFLSYFLLEGRTPAKVLCGLRLIGTREPALRTSQIITRELAGKTVLGIIVPLLLVRAIFEYRHESTIPLFEAIGEAVAMLIVLVVSWVSLLANRRTWWDAIAGTTMTRQRVSNRWQLRGTLIGATILVVTTASVIYYPFVKNMGNIKYSYFPKYPPTREVQEYADFVRHNAQDPVNYIFSLFEKYDIVVISERMHPEYTQYQLITRIVRDPRFVNEVGNLFTECGSVSFQDTLNTLMRTSFKSADSLDLGTALLQRNSNAIWPLWDNTNLYDLLESVNQLNAGLTDSAKINWYFTDLPVDWRRMDHRQFVAAYTSTYRDSFMAEQVLRRYENELQRRRRHKALVIMNSRHGYGLAGTTIPEAFRREYGAGTAAYLVSQLPNRVATVMLNTASIRYAYAFTPIQQGKWDAAFSLLKNPDAAFDFAGSPFGDDVFDAGFRYCPSVTYKDMFTGFIFFKPLEEHFDKSGFPHEFDGFEDSVLRRSSYVSQSLVKQWGKNIDRYEKDRNALITTEPERYALIVNLIQLALMPIMVIISLILNLLLAIFRRPLA